MLGEDLEKSWHVCEFQIRKLTFNSSCNMGSWSCDLDANQGQNLILTNPKGPLCYHDGFTVENSAASSYEPVKGILVQDGDIFLAGGDLRRNGPWLARIPRH